MALRPDKICLFVLALVPFAWLLFGLFNGSLGPNPVETLTHETGDWALRILLISLAITPLRRVFRLNRLIAYRRMLGLFAFFYAVLHFSIYLVFDHYFDLNTIIEDIIKRPYITVGFAAFLILIPLAATSWTALQSRMGKRWIRLHQTVYAAAILAVIHFLWLVKADITEPAIYGGVLALLLGVRVYYFYRRRSRKR
ncbi:MAG: protein-methionine-sulfoxide reductase heme-binding subunit MsrQ [Pseudomonadota bacterium]